MTEKKYGERNLTLHHFVNQIPDSDWPHLETVFFYSECTVKNIKIKICISLWVVLWNKTQFCTVFEARHIK